MGMYLFDAPVPYEAQVFWGMVRGMVRGHLPEANAIASSSWSSTPRVVLRDPHQARTSARPTGLPTGRAVHTSGATKPFFTHAKLKIFFEIYRQNPFLS